MRGTDTQRLTDGEIFYIIKNGVRLTGMPAWGDEHDDADNWKLVHFIRHLPNITPGEIEEMQQMMGASNIPHGGHDVVLFIVSLVFVDDRKSLQLASEFLRRDGAWIEPTIIEIKQCLDSDGIPRSNPTCQHCAYRKLIHNESLKNQLSFIIFQILYIVY